MDTTEGPKSGRKGIDWESGPERDYVELGHDIATIARTYGCSTQLVGRQRRTRRWDEKRAAIIKQRLETSKTPDETSSGNASRADKPTATREEPGRDRSSTGIRALGSTGEETSGETSGEYIPPGGSGAPIGEEPFDPLGRHASIADRISLNLELTLKELEDHPHDPLVLKFLHARASTLHTIIDAADRSVRLSRDVRGLRIGEPSKTEAAEGVTTEVKFTKQIVPAPTRPEAPAT